jgi:pyruvate/2-oxoglutarate dehydrogenase complex dihydrolipoamide dehydrogenase (E3) component
VLLLLAVAGITPRSAVSCNGITGLDAVASIAYTLPPVASVGLLETAAKELLLGICEDFPFSLDELLRRDRQAK